MKIVQGKLTPELKKRIYEGFEEHALEQKGVSKKEDPVSFCIQDSKGELMSAVVCRMFWGAMHIKYVWTNKAYRGKGYASLLMQKAFDFAKERKCPFAFVETMNFQAPDFYKKLGFEVELVRNGFAEESSFYYMRKNFL